MGGCSGIDLVPVHAECVGTGVLRRAPRPERLPKDPVAHLPHDADLTGTALKAPARGLSTSKEIAEPVSVHHMDVSTLPTELLRTEEFAAVVAVWIHDLLTGKVAMDQQRHLRRPVVTPTSTSARRPLRAPSLGDPLVIDKNPSGVGNNLPPEAGDPPVTLAKLLVPPSHRHRTTVLA
jgi:hypothetical protein